MVEFPRLLDVNGKCETVFSYEDVLEIVNKNCGDEVFKLLRDRIEELIEEIEELKEDDI